MITHTTGMLFQADYEVETIENEDGQICATYPLKMYFLKGAKGEPSVQSSNILREPLQHGARFGRVRTRYPMPVILYRGRNICRSSSLTMRLEALVQTTHNTIRDTLGYSDGTSGSSPELQGSQNEEGPSDSAEMAELLQTLQSDQSTAMDRHRLADITLIRTLRVTHIADLMLENCKRFMGVSVCSSEKNDSYKRYADFTLLVLPYPGVEFFKHFNPSEPELAKSLHFDWSAWPAVNRPPGSLSYGHATISDWDAITITQNYLKTMLYCLCDSTCNGMLVHCISGWDRTPLFVSLLRISLWADGEIHQTLTAEQILYLTIAYDWMMFRHQLVLRQMHEEDIFAFCFYFLEHITSSEFSVHTMTRRIGTGTAAMSIPNPAPVYRPSTLSYVSQDDDPHSAPSIAPSQAYSAIKAKTSKPRDSPAKSRNTEADSSFGSPAPSNSSSKPKSFLDGLIISSYHGNSTLEEAMSGHQMQDIVYRNTQEDELEDIDGPTPGSSFGSFSDDSPSNSFQPISFGEPPPAPPPSYVDQAPIHSASSPVASSASASYSTSPPNTTSEKLEEDVMPHPLDKDSPAQSVPTENGANVSDSQAKERKERLDAVREAFIGAYSQSVRPYFQEKRAAAPTGLWKWIPTFGLTGSSDAVKRN